MTNESPQAVFLEHESWLRTVVRSRLNEPDAVEDVMQNIAMAIVKQASVIGEVSRMGAWLYQIAVRQVLMYRRTTGRRRKMQTKLLVDPSVRGEQSSPVEGVLAAETQENVQKAMRELSDIDRQILMLKYTEGWSYRDLAKHLGVQEDTVEYRLTRARKMLRKQLVLNGEQGD